MHSSVRNYQQRSLYVYHTHKKMLGKWNKSSDVGGGGGGGSKHIIKSDSDDAKNRVNGRVTVELWPMLHRRKDKLCASFWY